VGKTIAPGTTLTCGTGPCLSKEELEAAFASSDYSIFSFTPDEQECISRKMHVMKDEDKPQAQKVAIAISTCAPSKQKSANASSNYEATRINIKGADYSSFDTGDGYVTVRDVILCGEIKKGTRDAPRDYGQKELQSLVDYSTRLYDKGSFCSSAHKGHNKQLELQDPEFLGFVLPKKVDRAVIDAESQWAVYGDVKLKAAAFERALKGELPFISPEISWGDNHIRSIAFLDSKCPHFKAPLFTVQSPLKDVTAKFEAVFERFETDVKEEEREEKELHLCDSCGTKIKKEEGFMAEKDQAGKPKAAPVEQAPGAKPVNEIAPVVSRMEASDDPKMAAKFAAFEDANAELKKRLDERDALDRAKALEAWGLEEMKGYQIGQAAKKSIAKFSAHGESQLKEHIEMLKEVTPKDSPRTFAAAEAASSVAINDPALAKFAQGGPEKAEMAARFASEYRTLKAHPAGRGMQIKEDEYIKFQMEALENSEGTHWGVNLGFKS
jgi:hypothetical protein